MDIYPEPLLTFNTSSLEIQDRRTFGPAHANYARSQSPNGAENARLLQRLVRNKSLAGEAALLCVSLVAYGHDDWYLPSLFELEQAYFKRPAGSASPMGGLVSYPLWTSTGSDAKGFVQVFNTTRNGVQPAPLSAQEMAQQTCVRRP